MLNINMPNARLLDDAVQNEEHSYLRGRDYYCHKTLGLGRLTKAYRDCKKGERQEDKGLTGAEKKEKAVERKGGSYTGAGSTGADWVTEDNIDLGYDDGMRDSDILTGDPSSDAKDFGEGNTILGMEKPVAIPVIVLSLAALTVGTILIVKKLKK